MSAAVLRFGHELGAATLARAPDQNRVIDMGAENPASGGRQEHEQITAWDGIWRIVGGCIRHRVDDGYHSYPSE